MKNLDENLKEFNELLSSIKKDLTVIREIVNKKALSLKAQIEIKEYEEIRESKVGDILPILKIKKMSFDLHDQYRFNNDSYRKLRKAGFSTRLINCLLNGDIKNTEELANMEVKQLLRIKNFGKKTLSHMIAVFNKIEGNE